MVLRAVGFLSPSWMIAVLLAASCIPAHCLDMTVGVGEIQTSDHAGGIARAMNTLEYIGIMKDAPGLLISK